MKKLSLGFVALSAVAAVAVSAQDTVPPRTDTTAPGAAVPLPDRSSSTAASVQFSAVDQNKDGRISRAEAVSHGSELGGAFATLDADSDTYLSQAEFGKWSQKKGADREHLDHAPPAGGNSATRTPATGE